MMGAAWIPWRTATIVIITILQIQGLLSIRTKAVTGVEGESFDFRCEYRDGRQNNSKYFSRTDDVSSDQLIWTDKHNKLVTKGRFSLHDNTTGAFFIVRVDELSAADSGTYWCGVDVSSHGDDISEIKLNVSQAANPSDHMVCYATVSPIGEKDIRVDKLNLPLYLTAVMCVAALLGVCLFTLCLLLVVKKRRPGPRQNTEASSDYETMAMGERTEPELPCSCSSPNCNELSDPPRLSPELSKYRDSTVTLGLSEYVDVDAPEHICQYQHLDLSQLENHVYNSLEKSGTVGIKKQIIC